jgi:hypothetical protein
MTSKEMFLHNVDEELHSAYSSREDYFETEVLHGFKQMQWTKKVIQALESERNRIIADLLSNEIVDNILNWMLEGMYHISKFFQSPYFKKCSKLCTL